MMMKFLLMAVIVIGALMALRAFSGAATTKVRQDRKAAKEAAERSMNSDDMVRCQRCESYYLPRDGCSTCRLNDV